MSDDPSEIILIYWFAAQETFLIIIDVENSCGAGYVLMDHVLVTISYSFPCLTTETVKYINENCFIENLAASNTVCGHREGNKCNNT